MTRVAGELLGYSMSCVRKLRVIDFWFGWNPAALRAPLSRSLLRFKRAGHTSLRDDK